MPEAALQLPMEPGARVRVLAGPFRGKVGVVTEPDGQDGVRVQLGLLITRIDADDLEPAGGRSRPALSVSHHAGRRKPR